MINQTTRLNQVTAQFPWSILFFAFLIISFHFLYQWWENINFWPIFGTMNQITAWAIKLLFNQSNVLMNLVGINFYKESNTFFIEATDGSIGWLRIIPACTSIKVWLNWFFIITLVSGPWKHKIWYFPLGVILIQFINVIRIVLLASVLTYVPGRFNIYHNILAGIIYVVIFLLWLIWIEKIANLAPKNWNLI